MQYLRNHFSISHINRSYFYSLFKKISSSYFKKLDFHWLLQEILATKYIFHLFNGLDFANALAQNLIFFTVLVFEDLCQ